jgi:hypothetical protein
MGARYSPTGGAPIGRLEAVPAVNQTAMGGDLTHERRIDLQERRPLGEQDHDIGPRATSKALRPYSSSGCAWRAFDRNRVKHGVEIAGRDIETIQVPIARTRGRGRPGGGRSVGP